MDAIRSASLAQHGPALDRLVRQLATGGRLVRHRRLRGGISSRMDVLDVERQDGSRLKVTLRRYIGDHRNTPDDARREWRVLHVLEEAGVGAPRPLLLDADGLMFGVPALVLRWLPGRPVFPHSELRPWARGLAEAAASLARIDASTSDLSFLEHRTRKWMQTRIDGWRSEATFDPLAPEIQAVLACTFESVDISTTTLVHNDYWSGNAVWYRGRVAGIVDWTQAVVGDPRADVSECRVDFALSHGLEVGEMLREEYERATGERLRDLWFYDLYRGFTALREYREWLVGYHDLGQAHVTARAAGRRLRAFLRRALDEARSG